MVKRKDFILKKWCINNELYDTQQCTTWSTCCTGPWFKRHPGTEVPTTGTPSVSMSNTLICAVQLYYYKSEIHWTAEGPHWELQSSVYVYVYIKQAHTKTNFLTIFIFIFELLLNLKHNQRTHYIFGVAHRKQGINDDKNNITCQTLVLTSAWLSTLMLLYLHASITLTLLWISHHRCLTITWFTASYKTVKCG